MSGSSGLVVRDQRPWPSFSMRDSFTASQWTWALVAPGAFRRKVTRPSAWTSGETSGCGEAGVATKSARGTHATKKRVRSAECEEIAAARGPIGEQGFIELVWLHSIAQTSARFKRKWTAVAKPECASGQCVWRQPNRAKNLRSLRAISANVVQRHHFQGFHLAALWKASLPDLAAA